MKNLIIIGAMLMSSLLLSQDRTIEQINFEGLKRIDESFLRRLIKVKTAEVYDSLKVATDVERLNRLPAVANATVENKLTENNSYILTYTIVENFTIIPGLRVSEANDGSFAFRVSVFEFNFLGQSQIIGGFYQRDVFDSYGAFWEAPFLFTNKLGLGINYQKNVSFEPVFFDDATLNYRQDVTSGELYGLYEADFHNKVELGVIISNETYDLNEEVIDTTFPNNLEADKITLRGEYERNFLNIEYQYTSGYRNLLDVRYVTGGEGLLDDAFIGRNTTEYFKRVGKRGNWASRLQLGFASFNESEFAPFTIDNQINLRGAGNDVERGTSFVFINTEYRHTLLEKGWFVLQGNAFVDTGTKRQSRGDLSQLSDFNNLEVFSGVGVRFIHKRIFNAVIRLDYGVGLGASNQSGIVFGIGQFF